MTEAGDSSDQLNKRPFRIQSNGSSAVTHLSVFCSPGKILSDDTAIKEYKIDEKNFVVVMVTKVRE